jgi:hypothetical protein
MLALLATTFAGSLDGYRRGLPVEVAGSWLPIYSTLDVSSSSRNGSAVLSNASSVLVIVHGLERDADHYFEHAVAAASALPGGLDAHAIIAPWFTLAAQPEGSATKWLPAAASCNYSGVPSLSWASTSGNPRNWLSCGDAIATDGVFGSCDALDLLLAALRGLRDGGRLPSVDLVTVAGFSAGGQLVHRYAVLSNFEGSAENDDTDGGGGAAPSPLAVRFAVGDPSTFLYHSEDRPRVEVCSPLADTGTGHRCAAFAAPAAADCAVPGCDGNCSGYDDFKYGLAQGSLFGYAARALCSGGGGGGGDSACPTAAAVDAAVARFLARDVLLLLGGEDSCNCQTEGFGNAAWCTHAAHGLSCCADTFPDADFTQSTAGVWSCPENALSVTCGAMLQGSNRLQRGLNYWGYLKEEHRQHQLQQQQQQQQQQSALRCCVIPTMGHNASQMLNSEDGLEQLFALSPSPCSHACTWRAG